MFATRRNFKSKLVLSYAIVVLLSFGFAAVFLSKSLEEGSLQELKASLVNQARLVSGYMGVKRLNEEDPGLIEALVRDIANMTQSRVTIVNAAGRVLADSERLEKEIPQMENHAFRPEIHLALNGETGIQTRYSTTLNKEMMYVAVPVKDSQGIAGAVRLALPLESVDKALAAVRKTVFTGVLFALGLAFVLASLLAAGIVRPIRRIISASRKFAQGDFSRRILYKSDDEIGELVSNLNAMAQDIENKIRHSNVQSQRLEAMFKSMSEGVITVDSHSRITSLNPSAEDMFVVKRKDADGKLLLEALRNNNLAEVIKSVFENRELVSRQLELVWPVQRVLQVNAAPIFERDAIGGCLLVIHDITEVRRLETVRTDFIANISHELKTPLTSIKGFVETLLEGALDDKENRRRFLQIIRNHTERLNLLLSDLLSLSYLESKEAMLRKEECEFRALLADVVAGFSFRLKEKGIKVEEDLAPHFFLKADKERLEQALINLVDNAIKFNKEDGVIRFSSEPLGKGVKITVEDSGIGIPAKDIPRIFERFYMVDKARSRELGGTGLGLSIVKHIIELHGGSVGVESTEGLGSKFWFTLPG